MYWNFFSATSSDGTTGDGNTDPGTGEGGNGGTDDEGDTDFSSTHDSITGELSGIKERFSFYKDVKKNVDDMLSVITNTESSPKYSIRVNSKWYSGLLTIVDLSWYAPYKELGDNVICIFVYLSFLWNIFIRLPDIIQGAGAATYDASNAIDMYKETRRYRITGLGRSKSIKRSWF